MLTGNAKYIEFSDGVTFTVEALDETAAFYLTQPPAVSGCESFTAGFYIERTSYPAMYFALSMLSIAIESENCRLGEDLTSGRRLLQFDAEWPEQCSLGLYGEKSGDSTNHLSWMMKMGNKAFCFHKLGPSPNARVEMWIAGPPSFFPGHETHTEQWPIAKTQFVEEETPTVYRALKVLAYAVLTDQKLELYRF